MSSFMREENKQTKPLRHIKVIMRDGVLFEIIDLFFEGVHGLSPIDIIRCVSFAELLHFTSLSTYYYFYIRENKSWTLSA